MDPIWIKCLICSFESAMISHLFHETRRNKIQLGCPFFIPLCKLYRFFTLFRSKVYWSVSYIHELTYIHPVGCYFIRSNVFQCVPARWEIVCMYVRARCFYVGSSLEIYFGTLLDSVNFLSAIFVSSSSPWFFALCCPDRQGDMIFILINPIVPPSIQPLVMNAINNLIKFHDLFMAFYFLSRAIFLNKTSELFS